MSATSLGGMTIPREATSASDKRISDSGTNQTPARSSVERRGDHPPMVRTVAFLVFGAALMFGQDHQAMVNEHGDHVMGFSHEKTTHHFELSYDGGAIDVRANDVRDTKSRDEIRSHFRHIAQMFAAGNFSAPMLVHGTNVPGTATMTRLKDQLTGTCKKLPAVPELRLRQITGSS